MLFVILGRLLVVLIDDNFVYVVVCFVIGYCSVTLLFVSCSNIMSFPMLFDLKLEIY